MARNRHFADSTRQFSGQTPATPDIQAQREENLRLKKNLHFGAFFAMIEAQIRASKSLLKEIQTESIARG